MQTAPRRCTLRGVVSCDAIVVAGFARIRVSIGHSLNSCESSYYSLQPLILSCPRPLVVQVDTEGPTNEKQVLVLLATWEQRSVATSPDPRSDVQQFHTGSQ